MDVTTSRTAARVAGAIAAAMLAAGCTGNGTAGRLSVTARTVTPAGAAAAGATAGLALGDGIAITRVRLAVQRIALEGAATPAAEGMAAMGTASGVASDGGSGGGDGRGGGSADGSGSGADGGDADEVSVGPFAVDLGADALAGGLHPVFDSEVPPGTYRELRIVVGPVAGAPAGSALAELAGSSLVVDGTIDGTPFTFSSALAATQKVEMTVQVAADGSTRGVTLTVDPHGWFRAADGSRLDPTLDGSRARIEENVRASIGAELEDDRGSGGGSGADGAGHA